MFRSQDINIFEKFTNFKICDIVDITAYGTFFTVFFFNLGTVEIKFGQMLMQFMTDISNLFLAQFRRLETSSRPFV